MYSKLVKWYKLRGCLSVELWSLPEGANWRDSKIDQFFVSGWNSVLQLKNFVSKSIHTVSLHPLCKCIIVKSMTDINYYTTWVVGHISSHADIVLQTWAPTNGLMFYFLLGISNFDLLGAFGRQDWLANFYLILSYNIFFGAAATVCLVQKFSASMRQAIYNKIKQAIMGDNCESRPHSISMSDSRYFD